MAQPSARDGPTERTQPDRPDPLHRRFAREDLEQGIELTEWRRQIGIPEAAVWREPAGLQQPVTHRFGLALIEWQREDCDPVRHTQLQRSEHAGGVVSRTVVHKAEAQPRRVIERLEERRAIEPQRLVVTRHHECQLLI